MVVTRPLRFVVLVLSFCRAAVPSCLGCSQASSCQVKSPICKGKRSVWLRCGMKGRTKRHRSLYTVGIGRSNGRKEKQVLLRVCRRVAVSGRLDHV